MKKVLLLTLVISMLVSSVAFADVTIEHTFKGDDGFIYHFGKITDLTDPFDAGIKIGDRFFSLNKEDARDGENALTKAISTGLWGIGIKDNADALGDTYTVTPYSQLTEADEPYCYTAETETVTKEGVSEFPEVTLSSDVSIASLKIDGEDADAVSGTTYYVAVEDIDNYEGIITATATDVNAKVDVSSIVDNQATVTVTAEDGITTGTYTVKFKEMEKQELSWKPVMIGTTQAYEILILSGDGSYKKDTRGLNSGIFAKLDTTQDQRIYFNYLTTSLPANSKVVGTATISAIASYNSTYVFYRSHYSNITDSCTFDEFANENGLLKSYKNSNGANYSFSIEFDSSLLDIGTEEYIKIALADGSIDSNSKLAAIPTLTVNYITLD